MKAHPVAVAATAAVLMLAACSTRIEQASAQPLPPQPSAPGPASEAVAGNFALEGSLTQGGMAIGVAPPGTVAVTLDGRPVALAPDRRFVIGFSRDAAASTTVEAQTADGRLIRQLVTVSPRTWQIESIPGLNGSAQPDPDYEKIREAELARIAAARAVRSETDGWEQHFAWPVTGRISGVFGSQRILGGVPHSPHYGVDIARPAGAPIAAPADGVVVLAGPPKFSLEGNLVIIDHGMGVNTAYLHLSQVDVKVGDHVRRGQVIGAVGMTGRATGPHLHWAMNWGDVRLDPELVVPPMPGVASASVPAKSAGGD